MCYSYINCNYSYLLVLALPSLHPISLSKPQFQIALLKLEENLNRIGQRSSQSYICLTKCGTINNIIRHDTATATWQDHCLVACNSPGVSRPPPRSKVFSSILPSRSPLIIDLTTSQKNPAKGRALGGLNIFPGYVCISLIRAGFFRPNPFSRWAGVVSFSNTMHTFHQKLNGTYPTDPQVSC